jgi:hypothetical protein
MDSDKNTPWQYKHDGNEPSDGDAENNSDANEAGNGEAPAASGGFSWSGPEYIDHERGAGWYGLLGLLTVLLAVAFYFLTKDYFAVGAAAIAGIIVGVYASRKPNQVQYELTNKGIKIGRNFYSYSTFRSFSLADEGELSSVNFTPIKRLMPPLALYFEPQNEQKITGIIGDHLPYDQHRLDAIDRLTRRIRF